MKNKIFLSLILSLIFTCTLFAQKITGTITDSNNEPVSYANVALYNAIDSSLIKVELSNDDGKFTISGVKAAKYWLSVSYVGLPPFESKVFDLQEDYDFPSIQLGKPSVELNEVTVTAKRPLLEMKPDKMVFNVEGSVNATGNDALELLKKAPGVVVDHNDNINMLGKSGVQVYIDGKPSPLSGDDLAMFLKTMQASEIDNIEIITNPSAKYDAEGTGGIINIRLKKDKRHGTNANINLGYAQGVKKGYNGSISSNYRDKKVNVFGNYSHNDGRNINYLDLYREQNGLFFDQTTDMWGGWKSHNFKTGLDYFLNKKNTIGVMVNGNFSDGYWNSNSRADIGMKGVNVIDSILVAESRSLNNSSNLNFNLNYQFEDGKGKTINFDTDYGRYRNDATAMQPNFYKDPTGTQILNQRIYKNNTPTDIDIYTAKVDLEQPIGKGKLGYGAKVALVRTDNTFDFYNVHGEDATLDPNRSNSFTYTENVNAGYVNYSTQIKKIGVQAGLRVEQTNSEGDLQSMVPTNDDNVKRNYTDFFPSAGMTYQLNEKNSFQITYSRRINRPSYQDLNPFEDKIDELTFEGGNPFLKPEYTNSVQLTHTFNYFLNTSIGYSHTTDMIAQITDTAGVNATSITHLNVASQKNYNINISGAIPITKWWNSYTNLTGYVVHSKGDFGVGKTFDLSTPALSLYSQHTFNLPLDFSFEASGWYNSASIFEGNFEAKQQFSIDAGIQKKLFDGRGNLKVSISDIFKTTDWEIESSLGPLYITGTGGWDSRKLRISFSYALGNNQVKSRRRKSGLESESGRIKSGN